MPNLVGLICDSVGTGVGGDLSIRLDAYRVDVSTNPDKIQYGKIAKYAIAASGDLSTARKYNDDGSIQASAAVINLIPSVNETYTFSFEYLVPTLELYLVGVLYQGDYNQVTSGTTPPPGYYTGIVYNSATSQALQSYTRQNKLSLFYPFSAKIPNVTTVEFASLINSGVTNENLDTSLFEIARITSNQFGSQIASAIFIPRGTWSNTNSYPKFSTVYDTTTKKMYWKVSDDLTVGLPLSNTSNWMVILEAPAQASQTITLLDAPLSASWDANTTQAPSVNATYDAFQLYATVGNSIAPNAVDTKITNALNSYSPPPTQTAVSVGSDNASTLIANTLFVNTAIRQFLSLQERKASNTNGGAATVNNVTRLLNTRVGGVALGASWFLELTAAGSVRLQAGRYRVSAFATANRVNSHRCYLYDASNSVNLFDIEGRLLCGSSARSGANLANGADSNTESRLIDAEFTLSYDTYIQLKHYIQTTSSGTDALGANSGASLQGEVYAGLTFDRLAAS